MDKLRIMAMNSSKKQSEGYSIITVPDLGKFLTVFREQEDRILIEYFEFKTMEKYTMMDTEEASLLIPGIWDIAGRERLPEVLRIVGSNLNGFASSPISEGSRDGKY